MFLISSLLNSISCCRIDISESAFYSKNFSISESVFLRFDVDCFSSFTIDFRFTVSRKVSNDFLRLSSAFAASYSVFFFCFSLASTSRHEVSLRCLKQISIETDISKTSQKHLKKDVFFATSVRRLKYISKKMSFLWPPYHVSNTSHKFFFSGDVFKASQTYLKKDVYYLTSLICPKNISWKYLWLFKNITQKWFHADKIDVCTLKTLKKMKRRFLRAMHSH